ncbi:MAG: NAD-dependent epimerase/dehydratase family protein, partial [Elusimicrobia bacterium]|nr:NAD-dependent epimerase/dehydratase family protein [Elusimicrobiota bacterium]
MSRILITGANGFVGTNLAQKFVAGGHSVRCLIHKNLSEIKNIPVEIRYGNIADPASLTKAVKDIDFVFHCAGALRAKNIKTLYDINQTGTKNLIEAVHKYNPSIKRFVYVSSQAAMGPCINLEDPKDPNGLCGPVSDYGRSKMMGEREVLKFKDKIPVTILRPAAIYGPYDKDIFT